MFNFSSASAQVRAPATSAASHAPIFATRRIHAAPHSILDCPLILRGHGEETDSRKSKAAGAAHVPLLDPRDHLSTRVGLFRKTQQRCRISDGEHSMRNMLINSIVTASVTAQHVDGFQQRKSSYEVDGSGAPCLGAFPTLLESCMTPIAELAWRCCF